MITKGEVQTKQEQDIVGDFRSNTAALFNPINNMSASNIEEMVSDYITAVFEENNIEATIGRIVLYGSRSRGLENPDSDIDIVVEIESDLREDYLFNILNESEQEIGGYPIDINPIRKEQTGTLETYLPEVEKYLSEKSAAIYDKEIE